MLAKDFLRHTWPIALTTTLLLACIPRVLAAQNDSTKSAMADRQGEVTQSQLPESTLTEQLQALQAKVATLEAVLMQNHQGGVDREMPMRGMNDESTVMSMMNRMSGVGMSRQNMQEGMMSNMGGMKPGSSNGSGQGMGSMEMSRDGMGMMNQDLGMQMMGRMPRMGSMQMTTALPGFPGASHIYHIGATAFFMDHPQHIELTVDQQKQLNRIKEQTLLGQATFDRWLEQAEQEVWVLTSADSPDATLIEAKIREIAKLTADKRLAYIQSVGDAARVLTEEQRQTLVGQLPPQPRGNGSNRE